MTGEGDLLEALLELPLSDEELGELLEALTPDERAALEARVPLTESERAAAIEATADPVAWARDALPAVVPIEPGPHHLAIGALLDPSGPTGLRAAIGAPRGSGKSTTALVVLPLVAAIRQSHRFAVVIRSREADAVSTVEGIRGLLTGHPELLERFPWLRPVNRAGEELRLAGGMVILARGAGSAIRGLSRTLNGRVLRPDLVVVDDLETEESARSKLQTGRLEEWVLSVVGQLGGPPGGPDATPLDVLLVGTTLENDAVMVRALEGRGAFAGWIRLRFPAEGRVTDLEQVRDDLRTRGTAVPDDAGRVVVDLAGEPVPIPVPDDAAAGDRVALWPDGMPLGYLDRLVEASPTNPVYVGRRIYAREYVLRPQARGDVLLPREHTVWVPALREAILEGRLTVERLAIGVDPAASEKQAADHSALVVTGLVDLAEVDRILLGGRLELVDLKPGPVGLAVLHAARRRASIGQLVEWIEETAATLLDPSGRPLDVRVAFEAQGAFVWGARELKRRRKVGVRAVSVSADKLTRATPLTMWHEPGRVVVDGSLEGSTWDDEVHAFTGTDGDSSDDLVDATVHAGAYSTNGWRRTADRTPAR